MSKQRYRKFTPEFKREAVRLAESAEGPMTQVARELGVRVNQIYKWRRRIRQFGDDAFPSFGRRSGQVTEVERLRHEVAIRKLIIRVPRNGGIGQLADKKILAR